VSHTRIDLSLNRSYINKWLSFIVQHFCERLHSDHWLREARNLARLLVSISLMGEQEESSAGFYSDSGMNIMRVYFRAGGKYCLRRAVLDPLVRKGGALLRCS
jgi:hypothetical protein